MKDYSEDTILRNALKATGVIKAYDGGIIAHMQGDALIELESRIQGLADVLGYEWVTTRSHWKKKDKK